MRTLLLAAWLLPLIASATEPDGVPGLVGRWAVNGWSNTAQAHNLSPTRAAALNSNALFSVAFGRPAYTLDGSTARLHSATGYRSTATGPYTVTIWFRKTTTNHETLVNNWGGPGTYGLFLDVNAALQFRIAQFDQLGTNFRGAATPTNTVVVGRWYHGAASWTGEFAASGFRLYVDGLRRDTIGLSSGSFTAASAAAKDMEIGGYLETGSATPRWWTGQIADVRIYSRALTPEEIKRIYLGGLAGQ